MTEYIEREAKSEEIRKYYYKNPPNSSYGAGFDRGLDRAQRAILDAPEADVAPVVHGHFVHDGPRFAGGVDWWHCSNCGGLASGVETRFVYCPKCGARMDGGDDGETD